MRSSVQASCPDFYSHWRSLYPKRDTEQNWNDAGRRGYPLLAEKTAKSVRDSALWEQIAMHYLPPACSLWSTLGATALTPLLLATSTLGLEVHPFLLGLGLSVSGLHARPPPRFVRQPSICGLTASPALLQEQAGRCLADPLEEVEVRPRFPNVSAFSRDFLVLTSKRNFWFSSFFAYSGADKGSSNSGCLQ